MNRDLNTETSPRPLYHSPNPAEPGARCEAAGTPLRVNKTPGLGPLGPEPRDPQGVAKPALEHAAGSSLSHRLDSLPRERLRLRLQPSLLRSPHHDGAPPPAGILARNAEAWAPGPGVYTARGKMSTTPLWARRHALERVGSAHIIGMNGEPASDRAAIFGGPPVRCAQACVAQPRRSTLG